MIRVVDFSGWAAAHQLLRDQPNAVSVAIAARAALRALPLITTAQRAPETNAFLSRVVLPSFRAALVSWVAASYPARGTELQPFAKAAADALDDSRTWVSNIVASRVVGTAQEAAAAAQFSDAAKGRKSEQVDPAYHSAMAAFSGAAAFADSAVDSTTAREAAAAAFQDDFDAIERDNQGQAAVRAAARACAPLWTGDIPIWAAEAWGQLRATLASANDDWDVWIEWYEHRLAGGRSEDADLDIACAMLPTDLWEQGPKAVNAEIRRRMEVSPHTVREVPSELIPRQGAGPHFTLGPAGMIALAPAAEIDTLGNNVARIRELLPLVRRAADDLIGHLNPNAFPELARDVADYRAAVSEEEIKISWGTVFGLGVMLESAASATLRKIEDRLQPALEDAAQAALDSILTLHGPLILATAEGRELVDEADRMYLTREEQTKLRADARAVARQLKNAAEIIEPSAMKIVENAAEIIGEGRHPERGTVFGIGTIRNVAIGLIGVAAISATFGLGVMQAGAALVAVEALKKSEKFSAVTAMLGQNIDRVFRIGPAYRGFVVANQEPLRRIAANTTQLRWMLPHIDRIIQGGTSEHSKSTSGPGPG
jgi:hypothetical protein